MLKILGYLFLTYLAGMAAFFLIPAFREAACKARWEKSGMAIEFSSLNGCMVQVDGRLIPEKNVQVQPR